MHKEKYLSKLTTNDGAPDKTTVFSVSSLVTSAIFTIYKRKPVMIIVGLPATLSVSASGVFLFLTFFLRPSLRKKKKSRVLEIIKDVKGRSRIVSSQ